MNTDNYQYTSSMEAQSRNSFTPFVDKQSNQYVADINSGVYSNSGLTLVQFDLSQIYNSSRWTSTQDMFLTIPIQMVAAFSTGAALVYMNGSTDYLEVFLYSASSTTISPATAFPSRFSGCLVRGQ